MIYAIIKSDFVIYPFQDSSNALLLSDTWYVTLPVHDLGLVTTGHLATFCARHYVFEERVLR